RDDASTRGIEAGGAPLGGLLPALNTAVECRRVSKAVEQPEMKREDVGLPGSPRVELGEQRYGPLEDDRVGNSLWRQLLDEPDRAAHLLDARETGEDAEVGLDEGRLGEGLERGARLRLETDDGDVARLERAGETLTA